ncbi:MAG TPA: hypothetical protein VNA89_12155 [Gemmatimonadaceae bacterium]|nr:hypothetical protein [Gemmatimonadaceae bacterium]
MRTRIALVPALLISLASGCGDASGPGTAPAFELVERYAQWRERGRSSYTFELRNFGPPDGYYILGDRR